MKKISILAISISLLTGCAAAQSGIDNETANNAHAAYRKTVPDFWAIKAHTFVIYGYIPYQSRIESGKTIEGPPSQAWFSDLGISPIYLVGESSLMDYPQADSHQNPIINIEKFKQVAADSAKHKDALVSLDIENWNFFDPETPELYLRGLQIFRQANPDAIVGFYSAVPLNSYKWDDAKRQQLDKLNALFADVAHAVDYLSPSLYNYSGADFATWLNGARYNMAAAKKYSQTKKILPYITPEVIDKVSGVTRWLTYDEMMERLQALKTLGADGCIIWGGKAEHDASGVHPTLDPRHGWLEAVDVFAHQNGNK